MSVLKHPPINKKYSTQPPVRPNRVSTPAHTSPTSTGSTAQTGHTKTGMPRHNSPTANRGKNPWFTAPRAIVAAAAITSASTVIRRICRHSPANDPRLLALNCSSRGKLLHRYTTPSTQQRTTVKIIPTPGSNTSASGSSSVAAIISAVTSTTSTGNSAAGTASQRSGASKRRQAEIIRFIKNTSHQRTAMWRSARRAAAINRQPATTSAAQ